MGMHTVWKKSITVASNQCFDLQYLHAIRTNGFDGIDLNFSEAFFTTEQSRQLEQICENLKTADLVCAQVHLPVYGLFAPSGVNDAEMEKRIGDTLRAMRELKAKWGAIHVRSASNDGFDRKQALKDNVEWLKRHCGLAEQLGVGIAVENLPTFPDRPDAPFFSSQIEDHCEVIDRVNSPIIGACWDFGHANLNIQHRDQSQKELLSILGERVKIVHVHNNFSTRDSHLPPAIGSIDWIHAVTGLKDIGYQGFFSLECGCGGKNQKIQEAFLEFCGKSTDAILEEAFDSEL